MKFGLPTKVHKYASFVPQCHPYRYTCSAHACRIAYPLVHPVFESGH
jgi:hypothetical protein